MQYTRTYCYMKVSHLYNLGHHICYLFIVYLTTLAAAQNVRRRINMLVKNK